MKRLILAVFAVSLLFMSSSSVSAAPVDPAVNPKAARSVHLVYPAPEGVLFYNEVTVEE